MKRTIWIALTTLTIFAAAGLLLLLRGPGPVGRSAEGADEPDRAARYDPARADRGDDAARASRSRAIAHASTSAESSAGRASSTSPPATSNADEEGGGAPDPAYLALRKPVVDAIRSYGLPPLERRAKIIAALDDSGASDEPWTGAAEAVFSGWLAAVEAAAAHAATLAAPRCFAAGCRVAVTFPDENAYRQAARSFRQLNDPGAPHGGRVQTPGAVLPDGRVEVVWIMLRPEPS